VTGRCAKCGGVSGMGMHPSVSFIPVSINEKEK
jgi:hypothetical protein